MLEGGRELQGILEGYGIEAPAVGKLVQFWELVRLENEVQNLTRIIEPRDFAEEHLRDSLELVKTGWIRGKSVDLGTGGGFPGIPCAILNPTPWFLIDSEKKKIDFVNRAAQTLGLSDVRAAHGRAENLLTWGKYDFVVSRAVGPIDRLYGWIAKCSTWNNLILMKGPRWEEEWIAFKKGPHAKFLTLRQEIQYEVGAESKKRKIVWLSRI